MGAFEVVRGDLFMQDVDAYVNAVNCVGVMGAGIAREFKLRFPDMYSSYRGACLAGNVQPGLVHVAAVTMQGGQIRHVVNVPTKQHWRDESTLAIVELGLAGLVEVANHRGFRSLAMPALGCGLGGLALRDVKPLMESAAALMAQGTTLRLVLPYES